MFWREVFVLFRVMVIVWPAVRLTFEGTVNFRPVVVIVVLLTDDWFEVLLPLPGFPDGLPVGVVEKVITTVEVPLVW